MEKPQVTKAETEEIIRIANKVLLDKIEGDFVEFGCYKGDTSVLLHEAIVDYKKAHRRRPSDFPILWLYDSFAGLPPKSSEDASAAGDQFKKGELFVSKREVIERLSKLGFQRDFVIKAFFEELDVSSDLPAMISFAFLDGDFYNSIKTSLRLVTPKLNKAGVIVVHDYNNPELPGATRAVDEFLRAHPEFKLMQKHTLAILSR